MAYENILIGFYFTAKHQCQKTKKMMVNIFHSIAKYCELCETRRLMGCEYIKRVGRELRGPQSAYCKLRGTQPASAWMNAWAALSTQ